MARYRRSRLSRHVERQSKRNLVLNLLGIVFVIFLLMKFGIPLLANFALFISGSKANYQSSQNSTTFINQPLLDSLPSATNSAKIVVSGTAQPSVVISLFINGSLSDKTNSDKDGKFSFQNTLERGENKIYVKAKIDSKESEPSDNLNILFKDSLPSLNISSPFDGQEFSKDQNFVVVLGSTDTQTKITVNGFWAIVDQSNNFSYRVPLQNGDNNIKVIAEDVAGNRAEKEIKVKYSP